MTASPPGAKSGRAPQLVESFVASTSRRGIDHLVDRWRVEIEQFEPCETDFDAAECAELAPELDLHRAMADEDDDFLDTYGEWEVFVWEHELWLPLEQCCSEGVLRERLAVPS